MTDREITAADLPKSFDVSVTVFARVPGTDHGDAEDRLNRRVCDLLDSTTLRREDHTWIHPVPHRAHYVVDAEMQVTLVMGTGTAARNGYLVVRETKQAFRDLEAQDDAL